MKITILSFLFFISLLASLFSVEFPAISNIDQENLKAFFRHILIEEQCAYVLFGDKPMGIGGFWEIHDLDLANEILDPMGFILHVCNPMSQKIQKGWHAWNRYKHFFSNGNYLIFDSKFTFFKPYHVIVMINRKEFSKKFSENKDAFKKVLGPHITAEGLMQLFEQEKDNFYAVLKDRDDLLGILLGYGKENAALFQRRADIDDCFWTPHLFSLKKRIKKSSEKFATIEEEILWLRENLQFFPRSKRYLPNINLLGLRIPGFITNFNLLETQELEKKFLKECRIIVNAYKRVDFLEITFDQLTH
jgi:hypothetical protein